MSRPVVRRGAFAAVAVVVALLAPPTYATSTHETGRTVLAQSEEPGYYLPEELRPTEPSKAEKRGILVAAAVLAIFGGTLAVSMFRGGRLGDRWYNGRQSRTAREKQGRPVEPTDNVRSNEW